MQNRIIINLLSVVCISAIYCSPVKTKFSEEELKWVNVYKTGDTLIFRSTDDLFDTTYIIKSEVYYPEYMPIEVHDKYLPQSGVVLYRNNVLKRKPEGDQLIYMYKKYPDRQTRLFINYLDASIVILDLSSNEVDKYLNGKIYEFDIQTPDGEAKRPKRIFWHKDFGVIRYVASDGKLWERINLPIVH